MLSIDYIRKNKEKVIQNAMNKNRSVDIDQLLTLDDTRKYLMTAIQKLQEGRNVLSRQTVNNNIKATELSSIKIKGKEIKQKLKELEKKHNDIEILFQKELSFVPNVAYDEVPIGKDSSGNVEIKRSGDIPKFSFEPLSHFELGKKLDIIDLERGTKVSGFRGYFLKNEGALLQMALLWYVFQKLSTKGYAPLIAPSIVKGFSLFGSGQFPWGEKEVYKLNDEDAYLAGTAEVPVTAYFSGEILDEKTLPKKFVAFSPCFRREAGSYGKDTRGLYRLHEFWKIEQVIIAKDDIGEAKKLHEELQTNTEEILKELGLPYRVMLMCTGDMGEPQMKKYDTEVWMPYRKGWGEVASNSIMGDFQARRLNIKYRRQDRSTAYCYTLNDTAIPSPRILVAILENYQQRDESIIIPQILQSVVGLDTISRKNF
ncbi:MAG TPA: serine--tRNA ligase [Patescibacteria group bacterium]|nr:serine--tRNA ligase [Patescibacteria group bacterium]